MEISFSLLTGIGIANIGAWIYLIALNLIILDITDSPLAVTVLYVLKPFASLLTNLWARQFDRSVESTQPNGLVKFFPGISDLILAVHFITLAHLCSLLLGFIVTAQNRIPKNVSDEL